MSILILGLNGCGKTTVGRIIAEKTGFLLMDAEDYYFPVPGDYRLSRTPEEAHRLMEADAKLHNHFVLCCVRCNVTDALLHQVRLAVILRAPADLRAQRIIQREKIRFGDRILPGGDLYESYQHFRDFAAGRTEETVHQTLGRLYCPIIEMDASLSPEVIAERILQTYPDVLKAETSFCLPPERPIPCQENVH